MSGFDKLARPYRWMEYITCGRALERRRFHFLPELTRVRHALLLGDGDGRFAAHLLQAAPHVRILAVDVSASMLLALERRCASSRVTTLQADLSRGLPRDLPDGFDLVATHFFLDCLTTAQVDVLASGLRAHMADDGGTWSLTE